MIDQQEEGLSILPATRSGENMVYCGEVTTVDLLAGQHIVAGSVVVGNGMCVITAASLGTIAFMNPALLLLSALHSFFDLSNSAGIFPV